MADTDQVAIVQLGRDDATAGLALSTEAHWNQNEADWRIFLKKGVVFGVRDDELPDRHGGAAALLRRQRLDQHGAGDRELAPPRHRHPTGRCVSGGRGKGGLTTWLDATPAGANVYGPLGFTRTCNCGGCGSIVRCRPKPRRRLRYRRAASMISPRATAWPWASIAPLAVANSRSLRLAAAVGGMQWRWFGTAGRRAISVLYSPRAADDRARPGQCDRSIGVRTAADRRRQRAGRIPARPDRSGWTIERPFQRMRFGRAAAQAAELPFAVAGPEFGWELAPCIIADQIRGAELIAEGTVHPGASARARRRSPARQTASARADALLHRRRRRRPCGRRPHHAIRDPRCRPVPARAGAGGGDGGGLDQAAAGDGRGARRPDEAGDRRSARPRAASAIMPGCSASPR